MLSPSTSYAQSKGVSVGLTTGNAAQYPRLYPASNQDASWRCWNRDAISPYIAVTKESSMFARKTPTLVRLRSHYHGSGKYKYRKVQLRSQVFQGLLIWVQYGFEGLESFCLSPWPYVPDQEKILWWRAESAMWDSFMFIGAAIVGATSARVLDFISFFGWGPPLKHFA